MGGVAGNGPDRTVVVILPYREGQVLMQLRDDKEGIAFPGKWGFFGGAVEPGESPEDAARRELAEEIGYHTDRLTPLGSTVIPEVEVLSHAFACSLEVELDELVLAYAVSVHKSQGAEYRAVVMPLTTQHFMMLQRNLLYTAVTRARSLVVLVGTQKALSMAVRNNVVSQRHTTLSERIRAGIVDEPRSRTLL